MAGTAVVPPRPQRIRAGERQRARHAPAGELLTERLSAIRHFCGHGGIDLWGRHWDTLHEGQEPFAEAIRASWRGPVADKYDAYSRYRFVVCYENMATPGWITEKLFDCFYAGVVPIYLGAPDIGDFVWPDCFIDRREFASYTDLSGFLDAVTPGNTNGIVNRRGRTSRRRRTIRSPHEPSRIDSWKTSAPSCGSVASRACGVRPRAVRQARIGPLRRPRRVAG